MSTVNASLPLDAATSLGIVQVLASVLPANALQSSTIQQCYDVLAFFDHFMSIDHVLHPLGKRVECEMEIAQNKVNTKQLQLVLKQVGVQWSRQEIMLLLTKS